MKATEGMATKIFGALMLLLGIGLLGWVPCGLWNQRQSASWPYTAGHVVSASVTTHSYGLSPTYYPNVDYVFEVNGASYSGSTISFAGEGPSSKDKAAIFEFAQSFVHQNPLHVYYDPKDPSRNCLQPGGPVAWKLLAGAAVMGLLSILGAALLLKKPGLTDEQFKQRLAAAQAILDASKSGEGRV